MGLEFVVAWAGRHERGPVEELVADYRARIAAYLPVRDLLVRVKSGSEGAVRRRAEADALATAVPRSAWLVALDREGTGVSSEQLAARVESWRSEWPYPVVFLLGSDVGLDPDLVRGCRTRWSLGPLTLPHALARLVVYEQLYRALSIVAGIHYHRPSL